MNNVQTPKQARPDAELIAELLDSRVPKSEREWAAGREIGQLREALREFYLVIRERHHGYMPVEVRAAYDKAGALVAQFATDAGAAT